MLTTLILAVVVVALVAPPANRRRIQEAAATTYGRTAVKLGILSPRTLERQIIGSAVQQAVPSISCVYAPTDLVVGLHPKEAAIIEPLKEHVTIEIRDRLDDEMQKRGFRQLAPLRIRFYSDNKIIRGTVKVTGTITEGTIFATPPMSVVAGMGLIGINGKLYRLNGNMRVGRAPGVDIRLDEPQISREHALFRVHGRKVTIEDLGSSNGTLLNGKPLQQVATLKHGDRIAFAAKILARYAVDDETEPLARRADGGDSTPKATGN